MSTTQSDSNRESGGTGTSKSPNTGTDATATTPGAPGASGTPAAQTESLYLRTEHSEEFQTLRSSTAPSPSR